MIQERNIELSVVKFVKENVDSSITVIDEVEDEVSLSTPTVATFWVKKIPRYYEAGNKRGFDLYYWQSVIYAETKTQRNYISYELYEKFAETMYIDVYDFSDSNSLDDESLSKIGVLLVDRISCDTLRTENPIPDKLRYQALITFQTVFQED